jgi:hypothetical protein
MKLSKEMIEGFGGVNSEHYQAGLEKTRVFNKKKQPSGFFWVFLLFVHKKSVSKRKVCIIFIKN